MEAYLCRGRFIVNLKYDLLVMMSLDGAVVSFYHVTSWYIRRNPVSEPQTLVRLCRDFRTLGYR